MTEKFSITRVAPAAVGSTLADGSRAATPHVTVWVLHEGTVAVFQFPAHTPQSHILAQVRLALKKAKDGSALENLMALAGKEFDL